MSAPESVVRAVMEALGCDIAADADGDRWCLTHEAGWRGGRCPDADRAADAAWVASLEAAAERFQAVADDDSKRMPARVTARAAEKTLLRWAGEQERGEG